MDLKAAGLFISFTMALFLFSTAYAEAIKISTAEGKVDGFTLMLSLPSAFVFSIFACVFQE
ncbi:hypothetical protein V1498_17670 [Peribacillus sp. SCS-26]|uniref:hypothetical protein n=1 Tax=Paraperibacillus marinus TaxID=3115295 RepID=UPI003905DCE5